MSENMQNNNKPMPFGWKNYALMGIGVLTIVIGFVLMSGGGEHTVTEFDSSIYSTRRITIAPIVVLVGFAIEIVAIKEQLKALTHLAAAQSVGLLLGRSASGGHRQGSHRHCNDYSSIGHNSHSTICPSRGCC